MQKRARLNESGAYTSKTQETEGADDEVRLLTLLKLKKLKVQMMKFVALKVKRLLRLKRKTKEKPNVRFQMEPFS
jgi:hypothetical protein